MGHPQGKGPLGRGCGRVSVPSGDASRCSAPTASALLHLLEFPEGLKREADCVPRAPGRGGEGTCLRPLLGPSPVRVLHSSSLPIPHLCGMFAPSQPPKGTEHLATMVHDPGPQTYTEGLVARVRALTVKRMPRPTEPPSRVTRRPAPSFLTLRPVLSPRCSGPSLSRTGSLLFCFPAPVA